MFVLDLTWSRVLTKDDYRASVFDTQLAERLGFEKDGGFEKAVQEFVEGMKKS